jgi:hypothetical protein
MMLKTRETKVMWRTIATMMLEALVLIFFVGSIFGLGLVLEPLLNGGV